MFPRRISFAIFIRCCNHIVIRIILAYFIYIVCYRITPTLLFSYCSPHIFTAVIFAFLMIFASPRMTRKLRHASLCWVHILSAGWNDRSPRKISFGPLGLSPLPVILWAYISLPDRTYVLCANLHIDLACSVFSGRSIGPLAAARCASVA